MTLLFMPFFVQIQSHRPVSLWPTLKAERVLIIRHQRTSAAPSHIHEVKLSQTFTHMQAPKSITVTDERCLLHLSTDVHLQSSPGTDNSVFLTCNTSCWMSDPQTAFIWSWDRKLYSHCESQDITVFSPARVIVSCAVKGHEDLRSDEICEYEPVA